MVTAFWSVTPTRFKGGGVYTGNDIVSLLGRGGWGGADGTGLQQQQRDQKHHHLILDSQQSETGASSVGLTQGLVVVVVVGWPPQLLQHTPKEEEPNS